MHIERSFRVNYANAITDTLGCNALSSGCDSQESESGFVVNIVELLILAARRGRAPTICVQTCAYVQTDRQPMNSLQSIMYTDVNINVTPTNKIIIFR